MTQVNVRRANRTRYKQRPVVRIKRRVRNRMNVVREFLASRKADRWTSLACTLNEYFCWSVPRLFRHNRNDPLRTERNDGCPFVIEPYRAPAWIGGIQAGTVNCDFAPGIPAPGEIPCICPAWFISLVALPTVEQCPCSGFL